MCVHDTWQACCPTITSTLTNSRDRADDLHGDQNRAAVRVEQQPRLCTPAIQSMVLEYSCDKYYTFHPTMRTLERQTRLTLGGI